MTVTLDAADRPAAGIRREAVDPAGWTGAELEARSDWRFQATAAESAHLVDMARAAAARLNGDPDRLLATARADFDLGPFAERVDAMLESVRDGPGIALYRGLPMDDLSLLEAATAYWAMGLHMGIPRSNNPEGDMIGHVLDAGREYGHPRHRGYQTAATMDYHCDQTDAVALLCIHTAKSGGLSKIASSVRLYNEVLRRRPDLLDVLTRPFCWTKHGETDAGEIPYFESPVFNFHDGRLSTAFGPQHIQKGHALAETPDMTPAQREAIDLVSALAEEHHADMEFRRGDIQILNNYTAIHTRTEFEDWPEPERKRVLWRLWLSIPDFRPPTPYSVQWSEGVSPTGTRHRIRLVYRG
ncbi:MAG: TauD/TfdA family dioxygenase [Defluviicoccus sp.]|nr:TauD/TfdA family dioxygenase [Defluviicoccus sp.]MDE0382593.1 TauD/TfdA family dioxygenase [Defluviicoccus sp.]